MKQDNHTKSPVPKPCGKGEAADFQVAHLCTPVVHQCKCVRASLGWYGVIKNRLFMRNCGPERTHLAGLKNMVSPVRIRVPPLLTFLQKPEFLLERREAISCCYQPDSSSIHSEFIASCCY
jgi:hypothetical protein